MNRLTTLTAALLMTAQLSACKGEADNAHWQQTGTTSNNSMKADININGQAFTATIADSETGRAFQGMLPLVLDMSELNGNEKYYYLDTPLPTDSHRPGTIEAGDLMLYGDNCVVLFYETFSSSYSYTRIGKIDNPAGLRQALGRGSATVTFGLPATAAGSPEASPAHPAAVYNTQGARMSATGTESLPRGVYIVKDKQGTRKIVK